MTAIDVDSLLAAVSDASPCGEDVSSGTELFVLEAAARGKPEQQFGDKPIPAVAPNWTDVRDQAQALLGRTRDVRVLVYLMRAAARLEGLTGYHAALRVLRGLVEQRWDHLHPALDTTDNNDPSERLNAIAALADRETLLADLRAARIGADRLACTVDDVAQAYLVKPEAESQSDRHSLRERIRASIDATPGLSDALVGCSAELAAIDAALAAHAPGRNPDLKPAAQLLKPVAAIGRDLAGLPADASDATADAGQAGQAGAPQAAPRGMSITGELNSRADASRVLDKVCDWLAKNEPSHPAPLFIRRAQRLLDMSFMEIIRDIVPESVDSVERLAGIPRD